MTVNVAATVVAIDPQQSKLAAKGDQMEVAYTEAVAVKVTPAGK